MEKEEFNTEIKYSRYKKSYSDRIIHDGKAYVVKRTHVIKGMDSLIPNKWNKVKEYSEILPLSVLQYPPVKSLTLEIILVREGLDPQTLRTIKGYFKQTFKISVKDATSNVFIKIVDGHVFMSDLIRGTCAPMQMSYTPQNIKKERVGEAERISLEQAQEMKQKGCLIFEELLLPNGESELRQLV